VYKHMFAGKVKNNERPHVSGFSYTNSLRTRLEYKPDTLLLSPLAWCIFRILMIGIIGKFIHGSHTIQSDLILSYCASKAANTKGNFHQSDSFKM
jgi:hypothetical protein